MIAQQKEMIQQNELLNETRTALSNSEIQHLEFKKNQVQLELELRSKQLTTHTLNIVQKNQFLLQLSQYLDELVQKHDQPDLSAEINKLKHQIQQNIRTDEKWKEFGLYFEQVHSNFYAKLKLSFPNLTANDLKHCALVKLNLSLEESAALMGVSADSVRVSRYRIQKKMKLSSQATFNRYLLQL